MYRSNQASSLAKVAKYTEKPRPARPWDNRPSVVARLAGRKARRRPQRPRD
jgi:hypothetical protein